jgi:glycosyltransferase involved in cell wall biosynthesis
LTSKAEPLAPITVAHVVERYSGGVATFVKLFAETQSKDKRFATVHVLADLRFSPNFQDVEGVTVHPYESSRRPWQILGVANNVNSILREIRPDIVVAHSSFPGAYTRIRRPEWPIIYCAHGWSFSQSASKIKSFLYGIAERLLAFRTAAIVNVSNFEQRQATKIGIPDDIQHVILNGLPDIRCDVPLRFKVDRSQLNFGFIGRIDPKKGMDRLLHAFQDIRLEKINLWIIGGRADTIKDAPFVTENIQFVDWIPNFEIDSHIRQLDALIVPSRWEAFSLVALEAMRAGRAVIASRTGGLQELIQEGENGIFVNIDDVEKMRAVLLSLTKQQLSDLGRQGRKMFESKFMWARCYDVWVDLIIGLASDKRDGRPPRDLAKT